MSKGLEWALLKDTQMAIRNIKKSSTSLILKEMQIKTTIWYYLVPVWIPHIKNKNKVTSVREDVEKLESLHMIFRNVKWYSHYRKQYGSYKIKNRSSVCLSNLTSEYLSKIIEINIFKRYLHSHVNCSIFPLIKRWENNLCIDRWMDKEYIYNGRLFSHLKEGKPAICNNMDTWRTLC